MQTQTRLRAIRGVLAVALVLTTILPVLVPISPTPVTAQDAGEWSAPRTVYIPETGHTINGWFLDMWRENGAVSVFGNPITPEITRDDDVIIQYLRAYQGDVVVLETSVSTGTPGWETPTGTFYISRKLPVDDMAGTVAETSWFVPDVPSVQYFTNEGHALHGTYWHSNFGTPMSHGCINLPLDVASVLYDWAPLGMRLEIHY